MQRDDVFRAIADPTRRAMIEILRVSDRTATELAEPFAMSRAATSQHLAILLETGLVDVQAVGRTRVYSLRPEALACVLEWVSRLLPAP